MDPYRSDSVDSPYVITSWSCPWSMTHFGKDGKVIKEVDWHSYFEDKLNEAYRKGYSLVSSSIMTLREVSNPLDERESPSWQKFSGYMFIGTFIKMK